MKLNEVNFMQLCRFSSVKLGAAGQRKVRKAATCIKDATQSRDDGEFCSRILLKNDSCPHQFL